MVENRRYDLHAVWNQVDEDECQTATNVGKSLGTKIRQTNVRETKRKPHVTEQSANINHNSSYCNRNLLNQRHRNKTLSYLPDEKSARIPSRQNEPRLQNNERNDFRNQNKLFRFNFMRELGNKPANEIMCIIINGSKEFSSLLEKIRSRDMMAYVHIALGKACSSSMRANVSRMINMVASIRKFLLTDLQQYLISFQKHPSEQFHIDSLASVVEFLQKYQQSFSASASDSLLILMPLLKSTCENYLRNNEEYYRTVLHKLGEIEKENQYFLSKYSPEEIKKSSRNEKLQLDQPPEEYRNIPILPTDEDVLQGCTFLRPNVIEGRYQDTEHYLDVQYRLLREDYMKPLRDGITEYLRLKRNGKSLKNCKDIRIYQNVRIIKQDFVNGGLVHIAEFDIKIFRNIKWEFSKRFITGSLLCLSSDDFKTMLFASVARRIPEELKNGHLLLRFETITDEVLNLTPLRNFVVIETDAYFEAYRHNLSALQELNEEKLPMKRYIVDVERDVQSPQYLNRATTYDMRPLLMPLSETCIEHVSHLNRKAETSYIYPRNIAQKASEIPVLDDSSWPSFSDLCLDISQYRALKAAITKEFAVIQGPPGTGKTFIGLRIVQLLLHNLKKWSFDEQQCPILIVCYTNHALDQFLEGLLFFTQSIVRVGGRGANTAVAKYQLSNLKMLAKEKRNVPSYLYGSVRQKNSELQAIKADIDEIRKFIDRSVSSVLGENILRNNMPDCHFNSLKRNSHHLVDDGFIIKDWLGIRVQTAEQGSDIEMLADGNRSNLNDIAPDDTDVHYTEETNEEQSGDEADIEFIESQRDIDTDEFADVSFPSVENEYEEKTQIVVDFGFQMQGTKKKQAKYVSRLLKNSDTMKETEALDIKDVWLLDINQRWQLYKFWLQCFVKEKQEECFHLQQELRIKYQEMCELRTEEDLFILQDAHVVGMTTTGAAKYRNLLQRLNPKIIIVEEAAEILESHIVTSLAPGTQHVILIGDHQQLRPSATVHMLAVKYHLNVSLFERMVQNRMECFRLAIQHRMRPDIANLLVPHIYSDLKNHESVYKFENIKGVSKNVFFITHSFNEFQEYDSKSKVNEHEARFLIKLCKYLVLQGYDPSQLTVLTTYSGQYFVLKRLAAGSLIQKVRFTVVDNFQGEENDIILISFVRSNEEGEIGFLKVSNRVCVALSRARKGLYCIGNFELLAERSDLWKAIVTTLENKQAVGTSLQLMCQNHPEVSSVVSSEKDFDAVPEGGCTRSCEFRLSCGHVCSLMCHPYDMSHESIRCVKPCCKTCDKGHQCNKKCYEDCGLCMAKVDKILPLCGHAIKVRCHQLNDANLICTKMCEKFLSCGHKCTNKCSSECIIKCKQNVSVISPNCGHKVTLECFNSNNMESLLQNCSEPCRVELACGHMCHGTCGTCHQGRLHILCNQRCKRILVCGHECNALCSKSCPPCKRRCENRCIHSKCPKKCGEPCQKCSEPCEWACAHKKCQNLCGEFCDRLPCDVPCSKTLQCGHQCIGLCGEPCLSVCRECDKEEVQEIFFGCEDEPDARFICLEDCKHFFEVENITVWMKNEEQGEIQMKVCPKCKTVIRKNLRFGNIVKSCLADIEKVKQVTYGNKERNFMKQRDLLSSLLENNGTLKKICKPLISVLRSGKSRSVQELTTMENVISIASGLVKVTELMYSFSYDSPNSDLEVRDSIKLLVSYVNISMKWITEFIQDEFLTASEQQLQMLTWEAHRLKLIDQVLKFACQRVIKSNVYFENIAKILLKYKAFSDDDVKNFTVNFKKLAEVLGEAVINVSDFEKQSILKAMGLSRGHWYQCPNGHVYCITECGGAMQESRCNECGERIGGSSHTLLSSNRVSTAMDGARYSAWSDAMNMENYRF
ncbi:NFX1-type zinc finger-containing protein 1, partial [Stegodyphus mimosarum]